MDQISDRAIDNTRYCSEAGKTGFFNRVFLFTLRLRLRLRFQSLQSIYNVDHRKEDEKTFY